MYRALLHVRNGPGAVSGMRVRKSGDTAWRSLPWADEAENFLRPPAELLRDTALWELALQWDTGKESTLRIPGVRLSVPDTAYLLP